MSTLPKGRTVRVLIVKEDENGKRRSMEIWHEEAEKWAEAVDGQASFCYVHGLDFPELKWKVEDPNL